MRTLIFTIISLLVMTNISLAQLNCVEGINTVSIDPWTNTAVLFPKDFLVDAQADGSFELSIDGTNFFESIELEEGEFQVTVRDMSTGETCESMLLVNDQIPPVAICSELVQILISDSIVILNVEDINLGSHDSGNSEVTLGLSIDGIDNQDPLAPDFVPVTEIEFDSQDVCKEFNVILNAWDASGNSTACWAIVQITDPVSLCDFTNSTEVMREDVAENEIPLFVNPFVENLETSVFDFEINGVQPTSYANGTYGLPLSDIQQTDNVLRILSDNSMALNGLSTIDLVLLIQFLVAGNPLSNEQIIASDLDKSGDLSLTRDAILFSKLILGEEIDIPGEDYFMIPENSLSINSLDAFNFENNFSSFSFDLAELDQDTGITVDVHKYGDLNGNFTETRSSEPGLLSFDNTFVHSNQEVFIDFILSSSTEVNSFVGAQAELLFQSGIITSVDNNGQSDFNYLFEENRLRFTFADNKDHSELTFTVGFIPNESVQLEDVIALSTSFHTEFITSELSVGAIELQANMVTSLADDEIETDVKVYPSPARDYFTITVNENQIGKQLFVINQLGQVELNTLVKNSNSTINISALSTGLKFVRIEDEANIYKLMVK